MKKEEILAICLDEIRSGKSTIEDCLARYPELAKEMRSLLEIAASLKPDEVTPSSEFRQRAKRRLFEEMQPAPEKVSRGRLGWPRLAPARVLMAVLIGLLVLAVAGGGTVYAAQSSLPGDTLYPVKTGVENLQLAVTPGATAKANFHLKLAQRRIDEATRQVKLNRSINIPALEMVKQQFDDTIILLSRSDNTDATSNILSRLSTITLNKQLELEQVLANAPQHSQPALNQALVVTRRGNIIAQVAYANRDFLKRQPSVSDEKLEAGQFKMDGTLLSIQGRTWNVGGVILRNVYCPGKTPAIGSRVKLEGLVKGDEVFISRIEVSESSEEPTKLEGQFGGTSQNGTANIAGIAVEIGDNRSAQLEPGDEVQLQGSTDDDGRLNITSQESQWHEASRSITLSGILTAVNAKSSTITVKVVGIQITVNVSQARIESENGQLLRLSDLNRLVGEHIRLDGLYKWGNLLFARQVLVEAGE